MTRDSTQLVPKNSLLIQFKNAFGQAASFLFLITLLAVPLLQPLFTTQLTCGFDTTFHLWRAVQASALLDDGILFSRWAPHMAHGYGYPLFMFQSPLSAWVTAVFQQMGLSWPIALNAMYGFGIVASGWTMWWLARTFWGNLGGVVAATAYLYAPFHAYVAFYRASLSETVAWSLPPLVLWGIYSWQNKQSRWGLGTAVFSFTLLIYTHDVTAYAFLPLFVGWAALWGRLSWAALWRGGLALLLGIGGSAFFWLPAIAERSVIQFERANSAWPFLYVNNFLPLNQLLALPRNADPSLLNDWPPRALGGVLLLVTLTAVLLAWRQGKQRWLIGFLLLTLGGYVFLTVSLSAPVWTAVPQLTAFQFPWRFLAPASFAAAFLCGGLVNHLQISQIGADFSSLRLRASALSMVAIVLLSVGHWGWLFPDHCAAPNDLSVQGMMAWEVATQTVGSTASGELLPRGVEIIPNPVQPPAWEARLDESTLPVGTSLLAANHQSLATTIELETTAPFQATVRIFNFPGWRVTVNDEPVPITPSDPEGWITFPVADGRSTIQITFGETPLRLAADGVSLLSLLLFLGVFVKSKRYSVFSNRYSVSSKRFAVHRSLFTDYWQLLTLSLLLIGGKLFLVDAQHTPLRQARLQDGALVGVAQPEQLTLGTSGNPAQVRLLGLDEWETAPSASSISLSSSGQAVPADEPLVLTLYWQALQPLSQNYKVGLTLVDDNGVRWSAEGLRDYRWLRNPPPTTAWPTDQYALTAFFVDLLPGTPHGNYRLELSFFEQETLTPLTFFGADGQPLGPSLDLGEVTVQSPGEPWPTDLAMQHQLDVTDGTITLLGSNVGRTEAAPGDPALLTLFWTTVAGSEATLSLLNPSGETAVNWPITFPNYGDGVWRSQLPLRLPVTLADGRYQWQLTFANGQTVQWSELTITAPERLLTMPKVETTVNISLSDQARLVGYSLDKTEITEGDTLNLELVWQAETELTESYRVFVHLLGADGRIVAQSDGLPANWTRPTTGWLPGEFIRDPHNLTLPAKLSPGDYTLVTGLYLPNSSRLQQVNGRDFIELQTFKSE